jgi:hypothetical protein
MGLEYHHHRPSLTCDKCFEQVPVGLAVVLAYGDLPTVSIVCEDCSLELLKRWKDKGALAIPARDYFARLLAGRGR